MSKPEFGASQLLDILAASRLFDGVDLGALQQELAESRCLVAAPGQVLLNPVVANREIYVILAGELLVCLEPKVANPLVHLGAGDCVGELSIIDTSPPSAYVVSAGESTLLAIPQDVLWRMLSRQHGMAVNLLHILTRRIRENNAVLLNSLELQRTYRNKAETDALTGLHNRAWFEEVFPRQLELCERIGQSVSLLMIDIDHFKKVNDEQGHLSGDEALRHLGQLLQRNLRSTDLCARYGGEEIVILMTATESAQACLIADRLRSTIASTPLTLTNGKQLSLTVSGGIAEWQPGTGLEALIRAADQALYLAKSGGRDQIVASPLSSELKMVLSGNHACAPVA